MDQTAIDTLHAAGIDVSLATVPVLPIRLEDGKVLPLAGEEVAVLAGENKALLRLKAVAELLVGSRRPPDFGRGPTDEYMVFFALIERTAADYCSVTGHPEKDVELERIFRQLRRRPDGVDGNPIFSYLRAAVRLYLSLRDVSAAELDAVLARLARSAGRWADGPSSTNYYRVLHDHFVNNAR